MIDGVWWPVYDKKVLPFWPYCLECKQPYDFSDEEPIAHCNCGVMEWGYPRPADFVKNPLATPEQNKP